MKLLAAATIGIAVLTGCASHRHYSVESEFTKGRGEAMQSVVESEWKRVGDVIKNGQSIEPWRIYQLADIRLTLRGAQTLAIIGEIDSESRGEARRQVEWVEKAMAAYMAGRPYPPLEAHAN